MKEIHYNKLVRDKIPQIIEEAGKQCETKILSDTEYLEMLDKKLDEELAEYHKDKNLEELADLLEVLYAAASARGYSIEELEQSRIKKRETRGGAAQRGVRCRHRADREHLLQGLFGSRGRTV